MVSKQLCTSERFAKWVRLLFLPRKGGTVFCPPPVTFFDSAGVATAVSPVRAARASGRVHAARRGGALQRACQHALSVSQRGEFVATVMVAGCRTSDVSTARAKLHVECLTVRAGERQKTTAGVSMGNHSRLLWYFQRYVAKRYTLGSKLQNHTKSLCITLRMSMDSTSYSKSL